MAKIVVVEDNADIRSLVCEMLEIDGHEAVAFAGSDGVEQALAGAAAVLLDLSLGRSGDEERVAAAARAGGVPLVLMTAATDAEERGSRLGAAAVVRKPFGIVALLGAVGQATARHRAAS